VQIWQEAWLPNIRGSDKKMTSRPIRFVHPMREATLMHSILGWRYGDGDNHDKGNDNGSPTDTKMTGQKDLTE